MNPMQRFNAESRGGFAKSRAPQQENRFQVVNTARRTVLATQLSLADTPMTRNKGLLGRDRLAPGEGLWIVPCQSVHTFFMRFPIDLVYLDRKKRIRKIRSAVGPWRLSACLSAYSILELPAGTISGSLTERGDTLEIVPAVASASKPLRE